MFNVHRKEIDWGGRKLVLETGKHRPSGRRRRARDLRRNRRAVHRGRAEDAEAGHRFLPAHRQLPGKDLRRRQDPRRLLQARRPADREGDADLAPDRPADPPAVPRGLPQRDAGHLHRAEPRPRERSRHRRDDRRLGRADHLRHPVHGPDRRARASATSTASTCSIRPLDAAAERDARPRRRRHRRRRADGRIRGQGAVRRGHARRGDVRPPRLPAGDRRDHRARREVRQGAVGAARDAGRVSAALEAQLRELAEAELREAYARDREAGRATRRSTRPRAGAIDR